MISLLLKYPAGEEILQTKMFLAKHKDSTFTFSPALDSVVDRGVGFHRFPNQLHSILVDLHDVRGWRAGGNLCGEEAQNPMSVNSSAAVIQNSTASIS